MTPRTQVLSTDRSYGFGATVELPYEQAIERTRAALKDQGFGVLTEIDVPKTMKEKLDVDFRPYVILGACNPPLARRALSAALGIGLLLPCNVVVYDNGDNTSRIEAMDPEAALAMVGDNPAIAEVAREARHGRFPNCSSTARRAAPRCGAASSDRRGDVPTRTTWSRGNAPPCHWSAACRDGGRRWRRPALPQRRAKRAATSSRIGTSYRDRKRR